MLWQNLKPRSPSKFLGHGGKFLQYSLLLGSALNVRRGSRARATRAMGPEQPRHAKPVRSAANEGEIK